MTKPAILAVDDDPQVLSAIARDLRLRYGKDYRVIRTTSPEEAVSTLRELHARGEGVALVLSDQRMPGLDGVAVLAEARRLAPTARRALLTAYSDTDAAIAAINRSQIDYYFTKPWTPESLYETVDDLLSDWRAGYKPGYGGLRIVGSRWMSSVHALKEFLTRHGTPYVFYDVERSDENGQEARLLAASVEQLPLVFLAEGERLENPSVPELARRIGLKLEATSTVYDVAIVGAGPAGLAAAVYASSEGLRTILLDREAPGGQAGTSSRIENYLGFPAGISGSDLARRALDQARKFRVEIVSPVDVRALRVEGPYRYLAVGADDNQSQEIACKALVLAMGLTWQRLSADCIDLYESRGVYYGAATSEQELCHGQDVYIVGAGNSAGQAAIQLARTARQVTMVVRCKRLGEKMSQYLVDRIESDDEIGRKIEVRHESAVVSCHGSEHLEGLTIKHCLTGATESVDTNFLFVFIGAQPRTAWLGDLVARDGRGFVLTGSDLDPARDLQTWPLDRPPFALEASVPGVFAAGDVRHESIKRVASAVGEGSVTAHFIHRHLAAL